jgi:hypothetical protein
MKINTFFPAMLLAALLFACKKDISPAAAVPVITSIPEFDSCDCKAGPGKPGEDEYIKATINGVPVCFDQKPAMDDTFPNVLRYGFILRDTGKQYYDGVAMLREASNSHWQAAIFLENTHALTKTYPYDLPRANPEVCEIGEFQLNNLNHYVSCAWCPENTFNYWAPFFGSFLKMKVTSFNDNVFEGTFEGTANTGSGKSVHITNGQFRIKLILYNSDIDVR